MWHRARGRARWWGRCGRGEQWLGVDRQSAGLELDADLEVHAVARRTSEHVAGCDLCADRQRDVAELGDHRDVVAVIEDRAAIEAADRTRVAHRAGGRGDHRAEIRRATY